jgi:sigma-B regulation protein RsbU (phosphoserine phosphatase)
MTELDPLATRRLQRVRKLTEVSRALTDALSLDDVLRLAVDRAAELLDAQRAVLMLTDDAGLLSVRASRGVDAGAAERFREPLDETITKRLQGLLGDGPGVAFLGVPLVLGGRVTGILAVGRRAPDLDPDEDEWLLSALADQAAVALEKTRLDEAGAFRERLLAIVGHDLRNPLHAVTMASALLIRSDDLKERDAKLARRIANSAQRMSEIIEQLLDLTRGRLGGGIPISREQTDLGHIVEQVIGELDIANPGVDLRLVTRGILTGRWDRARLGQLVSNLVGNAIQHGGGGEPITVTTEDAGDDVVLQVHNGGAPIPEQLLPHLFDPFRRGAEQGRSPRGLGLGLGLYIAQQIALAHGGEITVRSSAAAGTTFTVRLPRAHT